MTTVIVQDPSYLPVLRSEFPEVSFLELTTLDQPVIDDRVGLVIGRPLPKDDAWMDLACHAEYVHFMSTGYDELSLDWLAGRTLTTAKGTNAIPVAEFAVACVLARAKNIPAVWETGYSAFEHPLGTLEGAKVAVLGYGTVGSAVVNMLRPFTQNIAVFRRNTNEEAPPGVTFSSDVDEVLRGASHIVLTLELTEHTREVLSAERVRELKDGAHIVNVGRAGLVDQDALETSAAAGHIQLSLDVTSPEPLPQEHPLRDTPATLLSPHVAWSGPQVKGNRIDLVVHNIGGWLTGGARTNVVLSPAHAGL